MARTLITLLLLSTLACTSSEVKRTGREYPPRPSNWPIAVHASADAPREVVVLSYVEAGRPPGGREIGKIRVKESMFTTDWDRSIRQAKEDARRLGGDAIYIGPGGRFGAATTARSDLTVTVYRIE
jgi:hypothetical protein